MAGMATFWLRLLGALAAGLLSTSCGSGVECGANTVDLNGTCVPLSECLITCQSGTILDDNSLGCVPELPPRVCDMATTTEEIGADGVGVCIGTDVVSGCDLPIACPEPTSLATITACGRIVDVETLQPVESGEDPFRCAPATPASGGACSLRLRAFDAAELAKSPAAAPLAAQAVLIDECGRFSVEAPAPLRGQLALELDDVDSFEDTIRTVTTMPDIGAGNRAEDLVIYTARASTDARWVSEASEDFAGSAMGAALVLLREPDGAPAEGVALAGALYFDEPAGRIARVDVDQPSTGANGAALTDAPPAVPTRSGQDCADAAPPFAEGLLWVTPLAVSCPAEAR